MCGLCHRPDCDGLDHFRASSGSQSDTSATGANTQLDDIIAQLNRGDMVWDTATPITYSFASVAPTYAFGEYEYLGFRAFYEKQEIMAHLALSTWSDVADISFTETLPGTGTISFANSSTLARYSAAHTYLPGDDAWSGDIWVNSAWSFNTNPQIGGYGFKVLVHEIGHAIGQPHPGDYNAGATNLSYENNASYAQDSQQYSIMSYWDEENTGADYGDYYAQTPMLHDIAAIQAKYGANMTTRTGDTVYGFNSTADSELFDFTKNENPVLSIWDAGGRDTLDFSGFTHDVVLDLNPGAFSSAAGMVNNISIAYGVDIENAVTGTGDDRIIGNALDNIVLAGDGTDTFVINVNQADAATYVFDARPTLIYSSEGTDQLTGVEIVSFDDMDLDIANQKKVSLLEYAAGNADVAAVYGTDEDLLYQHLLVHGLSEGRTVEFSAMDYIASYQDLIEAFGADTEAGARHFIEFGLAEGRSITFDETAFLDANPDLIDLSDSHLSAAQLYIEMAYM